mmetsp:Transcript_12050/g.24423  ORF Transcript_12050/g.24423 Transcript_12050/m.24423 type:complete len:203 (+) Transcript_12050:636-1244(+)
MVGRFPDCAKSLRFDRAFMMMTGTSVSASRPMMVGSKFSCTLPSSPNFDCASFSRASFLALRLLTASLNSAISASPSPASPSSSSPTRSESSRSEMLSTPMPTSTEPNWSSPACFMNLSTPSSPSASRPSSSSSASVSPLSSSPSTPPFFRALRKAPTSCSSSALRSSRACSFLRSSLMVSARSRPPKHTNSRWLDTKGSSL